MRVIIDFGNDVGASEREVRYTLMDALAEFQSNRGPTTEGYIARRYPNEPAYAWMDRDDKARQINRRKWVAEEMRCSIVSIEGE